MQNPFNFLTSPQPNQQKAANNAKKAANNAKKAANVRRAETQKRANAEFYKQAARFANVRNGTQKSRTRKNKTRKSNRK